VEPYQSLSQIHNDEASPAKIPVVAGCQIFPRSDSPEYAFNTDISKYPLDPLSSQYIDHYPGHLLQNFGEYEAQGFPINIVPEDQPLVHVTITRYPDVSNPGPYPVPANAEIEAPSNGPDRIMIVLQRRTCLLYEFWHAAYSSSYGWTAATEATFNLTTGALRPIGWTSALEAGTPVLPGLIRCSEVKKGAIHHVINLTMDGSQEGFILPAEHYNSTSYNPALMPMGLRIRLKASYDISGFTGQAHTIAVALKNYGFIMVEDGPQQWNYLGEGDTNCWNNSELSQLQRVPSTAFEVVETGSILR
jgi:hypothetical protein